MLSVPAAKVNLLGNGPLLAEPLTEMALGDQVSGQTVKDLSLVKARRTKK